MAKGSQLAEIKLFKGLSNDQLARIEAAGELVEYDIGDTIFEEGNKGTHVYCLVSGRVEISLALGSTSEQAPVHTATPGSVFGEFVLFDKCNRSATARAIKSASILTIDADSMRGIFAEDPQAGYKTMDNLCMILIERMSKTTHELRSSLMW